MREAERLGVTGDACAEPLLGSADRQAVDDRLIGDDLGDQLALLRIEADVLTRSVEPVLLHRKAEIGSLDRDREPRHVAMLSTVLLYRRVGDTAAVGGEHLAGAGHAIVGPIDLVMGKGVLVGVGVGVAPRRVDRSLDAGRVRVHQQQARLDLEERSIGEDLHALDLDARHGSLGSERGRLGGVLHHFLLTLGG